MRTGITVFCAALAVRLIYLLLFHDPSTAGSEDSPMYLMLAEKFKSAGLLEAAGDRTPGYPVFLAALSYAGFSSTTAIVFIQAVIDALSCVITAMIYKNCFGRGALLCGLLMALNLNMVILSGLILPETLFLFVFILSISFFVAALKSANFMKLAAAMLLLALAALIRPAAFYLYIIMPVLLLMAGLFMNKNPARLLFSILGVLLISFPLLAFQMTQNYRHYGSAQFVSQGGTHLLNWVVPGVYQYSGNGSYTKGLERSKQALDSQMAKDGLERLPKNPFAASAYQTDVAMQLLTKLGPAAVAKAWTIGSTLNLISPSLAFAPAFRALDHSSFYMTPGNNIAEKLTNYVSDGKGLLFVSLLVVGTLSSGLFLAAGLCGLVVMLRTRDRQIILTAIFFFLAAGYFLAITGPIIGPKYRIPIEPFLVLSAAYLLCHITKGCRFLR